MNKLQELQESYSGTKKVGATGEKLAADLIFILDRIDKLLYEFNVISQDAELMAKLAESAGGNQLEYTGTVAMLLGKASSDIKALS